MRRREFITLLSGTAVTLPHAARAQRLAMPVIGFLGIRSPAELTHLVDAFRRAIPIVFVSADIDPVKAGIVASLNRPGGNITGIAPFTMPLAAKRLELLHELVPNTTLVGLLVNPSNPNSESETRDVQAAALTLGLKVVVANADNERDFDAAFTTFARRQIGALVIASDPMFLSRREQLIALTARLAVPTVYFFREFAAAGGLLSYAPSLTDAYRLVGVYVGRILRGERPADLPIIQPTKFELVINMKAAKTLGLVVPNSMQFLADELIE